ncbi:MAG: acyloxyacyl hydrolase [Desulfocapsaceae bacterium]
MLLSVSICRAAPIDEIRFGALYHDLGGWGGSGNEGGFDINAELVFAPSIDLFSGILRPNLGFSLNSTGDTSKVYGGGVWEYRWPKGYFVDLALGLAVHDGETDEGELAGMNQLGSPVLFRLALETGFAFGRHHLISIMFDHISNGYLAEPNEGLDTLGLRYGYRF